MGDNKASRVFQNNTEGLLKFRFCPNQTGADYVTQNMTNRKTKSSFVYATDKVELILSY